MKLTTRDIAGFLGTRPKVPVVLIYGPDHGMVRERADTLGKHIVADLNDAFNTATFSGDQIIADPARFNDEASAISMMGGDRLIRVSDAVDGMTATIKAYLKNPVPGTFIIMTADELGTKSTLRKLCETENNAAALPCYVQDAGEIARVITTAVREAGLRIEPDAANFMAAAIGGDHQQIKSEIEKLLTYMGVDKNGKGSGTITYDDAVACSGAMGLANLDGFIDKFMTGDVQSAFTLLPRLEDDGVNMIVILRSILAHGRKLHATHLRIEQGEDINMILESRDAPVFFKRKTFFAQQLRLWPLPRLQKLMHEILGLEAKMKSGIDPDIVLPQALLSLSARAGRAA